MICVYLLYDQNIVPVVFAVFKAEMMKYVQSKCCGKDCWALNRRDDEPCWGQVTWLREAHDAADWVTVHGCQGHQTWPTCTYQTPNEEEPMTANDKIVYGLHRLLTAGHTVQIQNHSHYYEVTVFRTQAHHHYQAETLVQAIADAEKAEVNNE